MKPARIVAGGIVLSTSLVISVLLCEAVSRLFLNPADYLAVEAVRDQVLGIRTAPQRGGFDEWGFRNAVVPSMADVVAIGDSHTYGNTAAMADSWPSVLARETGLTVYNLGVGGYGPNQYAHLLTTRAVKLRPKWVLCGLYMGDDFENAFSITYGLEYWSALRNGPWSDVDANIWGDAEAPGVAAGARNWLSRRSMVYRVVFHGPVFGGVKESLRFKMVSLGRDAQATVLSIPDRKIREAFRPTGLAARLDQSSDRVREGMRVTFKLLEDMSEVCKREGCSFVVVIIPTKETVFATEFTRMPHIHLGATVQRVISDERVAKSALVQFLDSRRIAFVDVLPALEASIGDQLYAQTTRDMHPSKNGYRVIGRSVAAYLKRDAPRNVEIRADSRSR